MNRKLRFPLTFLSRKSFFTQKSILFSPSRKFLSRNLREKHHSRKFMPLISRFFILGGIGNSIKHLLFSQLYIGHFCCFGVAMLAAIISSKMLAALRKSKFFSEISYPPQYQCRFSESFLCAKVRCCISINRLF